jgi:hypothetical protein
MSQVFPHETKQNKVKRKQDISTVPSPNKGKLDKHSCVNRDQTWGSMVSSCRVGSAVLWRLVRCLTRTGHSGSFALWAAPQEAYFKGG